MLTRLLVSPPAAWCCSVLRHDPPDALPRQTHRPADCACHLHLSSSQVPGAAEPSAVLKEQRLLSAPMLVWCLGSAARLVCAVSLFYS